MRRIVECRTQVELDAALKIDPAEITLKVYFNAHVDAWGSAHVVAWESAHVDAWGSAHVDAWGSAHVEARGSAHVEARGSAHVEARGSAHVEAWGSAHVEAWGSAHVVAWGSAHVEARGSAHVEAWGSAHVVAWESAHVVARGYCSITASGTAIVRLAETCAALLLNFSGKCTGSANIRRLTIDTAKAWLEYHGVEIKEGIATLYKCVNDKWTTDRGTDYSPKQIPRAPDWDGGDQECGGGLHFGFLPNAAKEFYEVGTKFLACPVKVSEMRDPKITDQYLSKIKAAGCCGSVWECDETGNAV